MSLAAEPAPPPPPSPPQPALRQAPLRLTRHFALASLAGVVVVTATLIWAYGALMLHHLVQHGSRDNATLAQILANRLWPQHQAFVLASGGRTGDALRADPALLALDAAARAELRNLPVVKLKIYNVQGLTAYSTDLAQIGEDQARNPGLMQALAGQTNGGFTHRDRFDAFEGEIADRDIIFTYVPVRAPGGAAVEAVLEVYADVTDSLSEQREAQWQVVGLVVGLLGVLYLFLAAIVRRADRLITRQQQERAAREAQFQHQAQHDALTGLPNRAAFAERLQQLLVQAGQPRAGIGLMFIDLDRFKLVNDSLGHGAGDALLQTVAARIRGVLPPSARLFRMGGDEFTVIMHDDATPEGLAACAEQIADAVALPVQVAGRDVVVGASIGLALHPDDGAGAEDLVKNADAAMYSAKQAGGQGHARFRADMGQQALARLSLEADLQKALRNGEFVLHYQPRLQGSDRRVVAVEALLRWQRPGCGLVLPGEFIGTLEDIGLMEAVGEWVLHTACQQAQRWRSAGWQPLRVSVNVSARQFQAPGFVATVQRALAHTGAASAALELELTESVLMARPEQAAITVQALKRLGVALSIDDFGVGYSSLGYLRHLEVDFLKVDRSFVQNVATQARDRAVATAIAELARSLNVTLVAEGVETEWQAAFFSSIRCGELQGHLFARALPAEELAAYLHAHHAGLAPA